MKKTMVSIIIPVYNAEATLPKTLDSVISQKTDDLEIICVDDGSTDQSLEVLRRYQKLFPFFHFISGMHRGTGAARNLGMEKATGDYIVFCDADDFLPADALQTLLRLVADPKVDVGSCLFAKCNENGEITYENKECPEEYSAAGRFVLRSGVYAKVFRAAFLTDHGIRFPDARYGEDNLFLARVIEHHPVIAFSDEIVYYYVVDSFPRESSMRKRSKESFLERLSCWEEKCRIWYREIPEAESIMVSSAGYLFEEWARLDTETSRRECFPALQAFLLSTPISDQVFKKVVKAGYGAFASCKSYDDYVRLIVDYFVKNDSFFSSEIVFAKQKSNNPKISVIIPVYNSGRYLMKCLLSLAAQTFRDYEVICVDDRSTDSSSFYLDVFCSTDARFRKLPGRGRGAGAARNYALDFALGKYLLFLDSDDFFPRNMLYDAYYTMENKKLDVCFWNLKLFNTVTKKYFPAGGAFNIGYIPEKEVFSGAEISHVFNMTTGAPWNKMFLSSFFRYHNVRFMEQTCFNDLYVVCVLMAHAKRMSVILKPEVFYRVNNSSSLQGQKDRYIDDVFRALEKTHQRLIHDALWQNPKIRISFMNYNLSLLSHCLETSRSEDAFRKLFCYMQENQLLRELKEENVFESFKQRFQVYQTIISLDAEEALSRLWKKPTNPMLPATVAAKKEETRHIRQVTVNENMKRYLMKTLSVKTYSSLQSIWVRIKWQKKS